MGRKKKQKEQAAAGKKQRIGKTTAGDGCATRPAGTLQLLSVEEIAFSGDNPRHINETSPKFIELVESVKVMGVVVPIHVRNQESGFRGQGTGNRKSAIQNPKYELLAGERRLRALIKAGRTHIPAINHGDISDEEGFEVTFIENYHRDDLTPMEKARACSILLTKYKGDVAAAASKLGRSEKWVRTHAHIEKHLSDGWKKAIEKDDDYRDVTAAHLAIVARLPMETQAMLLDRIDRDDLKTVTEFEKEVSQLMRLLKKAPFDITGTRTVGKKQVCCLNCQKRSGAHPGLFEDEADSAKTDTCLDLQCWQGRIKLWLTEQSREFKKEYPSLKYYAEGEHDHWLERELQSLFGHQNFLKSWDMDGKLLKNKADKTIPVMLVAGPDIGELRWAKKHAQSGGSLKKSAAGKAEDKKAKDLAAQWKEYGKKLSEHLAKTELADCDNTVSPEHTLLSLAAFFGISITMYGDDDLGKLIRNLSGKTQTADLINDLWRLIRDEEITDNLYGSASDLVYRFAKLVDVIARLVKFSEPSPQMPEAPVGGTDEIEQREDDLDDPNGEKAEDGSEQ